MHEKNTAAFTHKDIVDYLTAYNQEDYHFFIDLQHPYFHTAGSRLTLYADKTRWAIVFEKSGYANTGYRGEIELDYFGNCLQNLRNEDGRTSNMQTIVLIDNQEIDRIENDNDELVAKNIKQIKVRDTMLDMEQNKAEYLKRNIEDTVYNNPGNLIDFPSLVRYLSEVHPALFHATEAELRTCLPADLPKLMQINEWHNEYYYEGYGTKPGAYETYNMIADVLVSRDTTKWKPTIKPNNNWRNWPKAGYM